MKFDFQPVGIVRSCFPAKFGIPRQPGLVEEATAILELLPPYDRVEALEGLEAFSHLWLIFVFHASLKETWKPTVRPPRLGGNKRVGVFASRSMFRPNPIGLSVVELTRVDTATEQPRLFLKGVDLLDGTPVLDIKPYLPYADAIVDAKGGYAPEAPGQAIKLNYTSAAEAVLNNLPAEEARQLRQLILRILQNDPRPAYLEGSKRDRFGMRLYNYNVRWEVRGRDFLITELQMIDNHSYG